MLWNFELNVFKKIKFVSETLAIDQMVYLEQMYIKLLNPVDNHCWQWYNKLILPL